MKRIFYITLGLLTALLGSSQISADQIKAAFDVGSGQTKMTVAVIDDASGRPSQILFTEEIPLLLGHALKQSKDGTLNNDVLAKAESILADFKKIATDLGANELAGAATAVFRESKNGADFIQKIRNEMGINLRLITQKEEGHIGFLTAVAASNKSTSQVIAWDSGGASFQITTENESGDDLITYQGKWGASKVQAAMIEQVQGHDFTKVQTANPATLADAIALKAIIQKSLPEASLELINKINDPESVIVSLGGPYSIFKMAELATGKKVYSQDDVWSAVENLVGSTDEELSDFPEKEMLIPRLVLMHTVMQHFGFKEASYAQTTGNTLGIFMSPQFWTKE